MELVLLGPPLPPSAGGAVEKRVRNVFLLFLFLLLVFPISGGLSFGDFFVVCLLFVLMLCFIAFIYLS